MEITECALRETSNNILEYIAENTTETNKQIFVNGLKSIIYDGLTRKFSKNEEKEYIDAHNNLQEDNLDRGLRNQINTMNKKILDNSFSLLTNPEWVGYALNKTKKQGNITYKLYYTLADNVKISIEDDYSSILSRFYTRLPDLADKIKTIAGEKHVSFKFHRNPIHNLTYVDALVIHFDDIELRDALHNAVLETYGNYDNINRKYVVGGILASRDELRTSFGFDTDKESHSSIIARKMAESYYDNRRFIVDKYVGEDNKVSKKNFNEFVEKTKNNIKNYSEYFSKIPPSYVLNNFGGNMRTLIIFLIFMGVLFFFVAMVEIQIIAFFLFSGR